MDWRQYDWPAIGAGVLAHVACVAVLSTGIHPWVGLAVGPIVGGAVTGVLAHPNLFEMKNGFFTGAIGLGGTVFAVVGYRMLEPPSFRGAFVWVVYPAASLLVGGGVTAVAAGVASTGKEFVESELDVESDSDSWR